MNLKERLAEANINKSVSVKSYKPTPLKKKGKPKVLPPDEKITSRRVNPNKRIGIKK